MKKYTSFLGFLIVAVFLNSCIVEQNYHFKKDLSGSYDIMVDVSAMEAFGASDSMPTDSTFTKADLDEFENHYNSMEGITNAHATYEGGILNANYEFAGVAVLNSAASKSVPGEEGEMSQMNVFTFEVVKNGLLVNIDRSILEEEEEPSTAEDIEMMDGMLTITGNMSFESKIKSVDSEIAQWNDVDNTITIQVKFADIYDKSKDLKTLVLFK